MKFRVEKEIFKKLPNACLGVVMDKNIATSKVYPEIERLLTESIRTAALRFEGKKVKEEVDILPYREAFRILGINPNKYLCSIEALFTRIAKASDIFLPFGADMEETPDIGEVIYAVALHVVFCKYRSHRILSPYHSINNQLQNYEALRSVHHVTFIL